MIQELIGKNFKQYYHQTKLVSAWEDTVQRVTCQYITFEHVQRVAGITKRIRCQQVELILHGERHTCALSNAVLV